MGSEYLIDTNAVIELLSAILPPSASVWLHELINESTTHLSVINQIELLGYNGEREEMIVLEEFINTQNIVQLSNGIVDKTIELRKNYRIKLPDAIVAATVLMNNFTLITRNLSDFQRIEGMNLINPHEV